MTLKLQIFILCRDRPEFAKEAIESAVRNLIPYSSIIVSDNSISDSVNNMVSENFSNISYIRRKPPLDSFSHFRTVLSEALRSEYVIIFHDDDIMCDGYVSTLIDLMKKNQNIAAVACNAVMINGKGEEYNKYLLNFRGAPENIVNPSQLMFRYLAMFSADRPPPFSSYCYRTKYIKGMLLEPKDGGKHSDVSFLAKVLNNSPFIWLGEPLIKYRVHDGSDSSQESVVDRLSLLRFIFRNNLLAKSDSCILEYKFSYWYAFMRKRLSKINKKNLLSLSKRDKVVIKFLIFYFLYYMISKKIFRARIIKKMVFANV